MRLSIDIGRLSVDVTYKNYPPTLHLQLPSSITAFPITAHSHLAFG